MHALSSIDAAPRASTRPVLLPWLDAAAPVVLAAATYWAPPRVLTLLAVEDAVFEWLQAAVLAAACGTAVWGGLVALRRAAHRGAALFAGVAAFAFAVLGEELAWGTRLVRFGGLAGVRAINDQGDLTLHNLGERGLEASFALLAATGLVGAAFAVRRLRAWPLAAWFSAPALYAVVRAAGNVPHWRFAKVSEAFELVLYAALLRAIVVAPSDEAAGG